MALKQVVLPAPFGPIKPRISPLWMVKDTSSRATTPPKRSVAWSTSSKGTRGAAAAASAAWGWPTPRAVSLSNGHLPPAICELRRAASVRDQPLRPEDHHDDQHGAKEHDPDLVQLPAEELDATEAFDQVRHQATADDRADEIPGPAEDHGGQDDDR